MTSLVYRKRLGGVIFSLLLVGCAHGPVAWRSPATAPDPAARLFTEDESRTCAQRECRHFLAPCRLAVATHDTTTSPIEDVYLDQAQNYTQRGFCPQLARRLEGENYTHETCLFLFIRPGDCTPP